MSFAVETVGHAVRPFSADGPEQNLGVVPGEGIEPIAWTRDTHSIGGRSGDPSEPPGTRRIARHGPGAALSPESLSSTGYDALALRAALLPGRERELPEEPARTFDVLACDSLRRHAVTAAQGLEEGPVLGL